MQASDHGPEMPGGDGSATSGHSAGAGPGGGEGAAREQRVWAEQRHVGQCDAERAILIMDATRESPP